MKGNKFRDISPIKHQTVKNDDFEFAMEMSLNKFGDVSPIKHLTVKNDDDLEVTMKMRLNKINQMKEREFGDVMAVKRTLIKNDEDFDVARKKRKVQFDNNFNFDSEMTIMEAAIFLQKSIFLLT